VGETVYVRNVRGANIATIMCAVVSLLVLVAAAKLVFGS
jgi:hypothetical protein